MLVVFISTFCYLARTVSSRVYTDELPFYILFFCKVFLLPSSHCSFIHQLLHMLPVFIIRKYFFIKGKKNAWLQIKPQDKNPIMFHGCCDFCVKISQWRQYTKRLKLNFNG